MHVLVLGVLSSCCTEGGEVCLFDNSDLESAIVNSRDLNLDLVYSHLVDELFRSCTEVETWTADVLGGC